MSYRAQQALFALKVIVLVELAIAEVFMIAALIVWMMPV